MKRTLVYLFAILLLLGACRHEHAGHETDGASHDVTLMTFNVQNLFDNVDDPGKDDKAYLPIEAKKNDAHIAECNEIERRSWREECLYLDWDDDAIDHKLGVLAEAIRQVDDGRGADIIAFQEVENVRILERLRNEHLGDLGYAPSILLEGADRRGIDLACLSGLPLSGKPHLRAASYEHFGDRAADTRPILEATFELPDGSLLTGFVVHFPAQHHPTEMRIAAFEHLNDLRNKVPADRHVFAAGDFNTLDVEYYDQGYMNRFVKPYWETSSELCAGCRGSYYYGRTDTWSFLDVILYSPARSEKTTWQIRADSVKVANGFGLQVTRDGRPNRYRSAERTGVSDHWPIVLTIESTQKQ